MLDLDTCTVPELQDELARLTGWIPWGKPECGWCKLEDNIDDELPHSFQASHPIPWTLDAIAALMPQGWRWDGVHESDNNEWGVLAYIRGGIKKPAPRWFRISRANTELEARARCVAKVLRHVQEKPK
jgi:hypothetical protein